MQQASLPGKERAGASAVRNQSRNTNRKGRAIAARHKMLGRDSSELRIVSPSRTGVCGLRIGDHRLLNKSILHYSICAHSADFSTLAIADFSISIFTLSATFTITVASFTLAMRP